MQKIFHNANIITYDKNNVSAEAVLVNDDSIVLVSTNEEVLSMKTDDTEVIDLGGRTVMPTFFDLNSSIYDMIETNIKNAKLEEFLEDSKEIDENYEKFDNYEYYKNEFFIIQDDYLANGITTVFEIISHSKEFTFWKKLAQDKQLKIDIIGIIKMTTDRDIMDNNCRSYRKYSNHFRLGGYYICIDGLLNKKYAWISKPYKNEYGYSGYTNITDEGLSCLINIALSDKKQLIVETNGDNALDQYLRCFEDAIKDKENVDKLKPIAKNCNFVSKNHLNLMKKLEITPSFQVDDLKNYGDYYKKTLGVFRANKIQPIKNFQELNLPFILHTEQNTVPNIFEMAKIITDRKIDSKKLIGQKYKVPFSSALNSLICDSANFAFDFGTKGSIENGKKANFVVLNDTIENIYLNSNFDCIEKTFIDGQEVYKK